MYITLVSNLIKHFLYLFGVGGGGGVVIYASDLDDCDLVHIVC